MNSFNQRRRSGDRMGAALVEMAIVIPVILVITGGLLEVSRLLMLHHTADTAAYEGARAAMVPGATAAEAVETVELLLTDAGCIWTSITVEPATITEETPLITVSVEMPLNKNSWITSHGFVDIIIRSEVTLFSERPPATRLTGLPSLKAKVKKLKGNLPVI